MTEDQVKSICKWMVDNANKPLTATEKELLKQAIDKARTVEELALVAEVFAVLGRK